MKKFLIIIISAAALTACSNDDGGKKNSIPADEKLLESVDGATDDFLVLDYNSDKTVKRVEIANMYVFDLYYTNQVVTSIEAVGNGGFATCGFTHDVNGTISGFTINDEAHIVEYDLANNSYTFYEEGDDDNFTIFLTQDEDIKSFIINNSESEGNFTVIHSNDPEKKGPMYNSNNIGIYIAMIIPEFSQVLPYISYRPVEYLSSYYGNFSIENTYDKDGFVTGTVPQNPDEAGITYNYTSLNN